MLTEGHGKPLNSENALNSNQLPEKYRVLRILPTLSEKSLIHRMKIPES
jgi:hypothetical protein